MNPEFLVLTSFPLEENDKTSTNNKPLLRHQKIFEILEKNNFKMEILSNKLSSMDLYPIVGNIIYFFENCFSSLENTFDPTYIDKNIGVIPSIIPKNKITFNFQEMVTWKQVGIWCEDTNTPIQENTYNRIMISANNCYQAENYLEKYKLIYCLNIDPGHHASYETYGGYCYLNNAAICASKYQHKVAILDLDHHAGNGTEKIFENNPSVLTISIHANPIYEYPFYSGHISENNLTFNPDVTVEKYFDLVKIAMKNIENFNPELLIIAFGGDTYKFDPEASTSCKCCLDIEDYYNISKYIKSKFNKNIIVTQEGGYDMENIDKIVLSFLKGFTEM